MKKAEVVDLIKGMIVLILICFAVAVLVQWTISSISKPIATIFQSLSTLDAAIVVALITGCVSIICVVVGAIVNNRITYTQKREEYLRVHREMAYKQLVAIFTKIQLKSKKKEQYSQDEMLEDVYAFTENLMLWGSSKAIKQWSSWRISAAKSPSPQELLLNQEKIIIQLRKDMGQRGTLQEGDILKLFINDVDENILNKDTYTSKKKESDAGLNSERRGQ